MLPTNKLKYPIENLIAKLQALPQGSTYEEEDDAPFYGGEVPGDTLGSSYQLRIDICEGFNPPRYTLEEANKWCKENGCDNVTADTLWVIASKQPTTDTHK